MSRADDMLDELQAVEALLKEIIESTGGFEMSFIVINLNRAESMAVVQARKRELIDGIRANRSQIEVLLKQLDL